jgi:hypothetical protein
VTTRLVLTLHAGSAALRCTLEYDNRATDHRLRLRVPTGVPGVAALAGGPFGAVARPAVPADAGRYVRETPVATAPAQRFVAVARGTRGLALLAPGFFEYDLAGDGDLRMTLLRGVGQLSRGDLATRPGHAGWPTATPEAQCLGEGRLQVAVAPVASDELEDGGALVELWEDLFLPPLALWLRQATRPRTGHRRPPEGAGWSSHRRMAEDDGPCPLPGRAGTARAAGISAAPWGAPCVRAPTSAARASCRSRPGATRFRFAPGRERSSP